jgi:hypothetical protein
MSRYRITDIAELRQLCRYRYGLIDSVSSLKNQITGILDRIFPEYASFFSDIFGVTSIELLKRYTTPDAISKVPTKRLAELLAKYSRGAFGEAKGIDKIMEVCARSVGIAQPESGIYLSASAAKQADRIYTGTDRRCRRH